MSTDPLASPGQIITLVGTRDADDAGGPERLVVGIVENVSTDEAYEASLNAPWGANIMVLAGMLVATLAIGLGNGYCSPTMIEPGGGGGG